MQRKVKLTRVPKGVNSPDFTARAMDAKAP
jgi:hypothetical protein